MSSKQNDTNTTNRDRNYMDFYNKIKEGLLLMVESSSTNNTHKIDIYSSSYTNSHWSQLMLGVSKLSYKLINNVYAYPEYSIFLLLCNVNSHIRENSTYRISWKSTRKLGDQWKSEWILSHGFPIYVGNKYTSAYIDETFINTIFTYNNVLLLLSFEIDIIVEKNE